MAAGRNSVILEEKLKHFRRFVCPEAIDNKYPGILTRKLSCFGVEDELEPLLTDIRVG